MTSLDDLYPLSSSWTYENGFYLTSDISRFGKLLAHYELYKRVVDLPGHVVELGVYKGASLVRFATFRDLLESPASRKIIGFDAFGAFPKENLSENDSSFVASFEEAGGDGHSIELLEEVFQLKRFSHIELIAGDVRTTVPQYVAAHPELRISLLHLDMDVFEPTKLALELLADRIVPGGLLVIDDYATVEGATRALEDHFIGKSPVFNKLPISHVPAYIVRSSGVAAATPW